MLKQFNGFKDERTESKRVTLSTYTVSCLYLPKERFDSESSAITLGMDMANEIYRCPAELFDLLSQKDKDKFRVTVDNEIDNELLLKRYNDRFPYFALQYLEMKDCLKNIYFHIDMGSYFFDRYEKSLIDGTKIDDRRLSKRILCFDKMQGAVNWYGERKNTELYTAKFDDSAEYMNDTYPHYHINNNQIGIRLSSYYPEINGRGTSNKAPDAWLSLYELPAIVYLSRKEKGDKVSSLITSYVYCSRRFFRDVIKGDDYSLLSETEFKAKYKINFSDLPDVFRRSTQRDYSKLAEEHIKKLIAESKRVLENHKKEAQYDFKEGKRAKRRFKNGHIADMLVEDFMRFQPSANSDGKDKISAPNYQALQASLALYGINRYGLEAMMREAGLIGSTNKHPFLEQCLPLPNSLDNLFVLYINKKIKYLGSLLKSSTRLESAYCVRQYVEKAKRTQSEERINLATQLLGLPVNLPRGLFKSLLPDGGTNAATYQIANEHTESCDSVQDFYSFKRNYSVLERLGVDNPKRMKMNEVKRLAENFGDGELEKAKIMREFNKFSDNELILRYRMACDILMFGMSKDLLGVADDSVKMSMANDHTNHILNQSHTLSVKHPETENIIKGEMKIRDYGNFRRVLFDKRLKYLFKYCDKEINLKYSEILKEFEEYDKSRKEIFEVIHQFEHKVIEEKGLVIEGAEKYISFDKITDNTELKDIRNAFSHHQYPLGLKIEKNANITRQIVEKCKEKFTL